jgi:hypothetical protein
LPRRCALVCAGQRPHLEHGIQNEWQVPQKPMLNELEFAYTPVREKVRDLREYL